jgi:cysteine-rich repeat protein
MLAALAMPGVSCFGAPNYRCDADAECTWAERRGVCEPTRYCSYPDPDCPSRKRYGDQAGELADRCVDEPPDPGSDESGLPGASSTSGADTSTGSSGSDATTSVPQPICGDGVPEGDERCDDGNATDGDGCNVDCVPSGAPRWDDEVRVYAGARGRDAFLQDVDVRPDDTIIAVGREEVADLDALFLLLDGDGEIVWSRQHDRGMGDDQAGSVSAGVGSEIFVAGRSPGPAPEGWIAVVEPATGDVEALEPTGRPLAIGLAYVHPSVLVVGGYGDGTYGAREYGEMLAPLGIAEVMLPGASIAAVAADGVEDIAWAAGLVGGRARVMRLQPDDPEPLVTLFEGADGSGAQGLAYASGALVLAGYVGLGMRDGWLQQLAVDGEPGWSWTTREPSEDEIEDVAISATGDVVAVGFDTAFAQDARVWKLSPEGELLWTWAPDPPWANDDVARGVATRPDGDIVVVGERTADDGSSDGWVVRLTP